MFLCLLLITHINKKMRNLLLIFSFSLIITAKSQNGFTTYTTNLNITGALKLQTAFLVDNSANKWIGFRTISGNAGLVKYDNLNWTLYNQTSSPVFPSNGVTALAKDNSGNIWIGTNDVGLVKFDGINFTTYNTANGLPTNTITCVETVGNQIYIGTKSGLSRFDGVTFTNYNVANGLLPSDTISCIKAESPNLILLGGLNRMVEFTINGTFSSTSFINKNISINANLINCIYIDSQNNKWLGTTYAGILKYSGSTFDKVINLYGAGITSYIPNKVVDIAEGLHNGIIFNHKSNPSFNNNLSGLTELAPGNLVFHYFYPTTSFVFGNYIEKEGAKILISQGGPNINYSSQKMYYSFDSINYTIPLGTINSNNFKTLDINNISAGISNRSDMHWDVGGQGNALYEVPKGSGKSCSFASALWIGGVDNGGQLHGAAQTYRQGGVDFWPGPLDTINASIDTATSLNYDKIWKVSYTDINNFITAFNSGSVVATPDMLTWPAHGSGNNSRNLAPFVDYNNDGIYNPNDGDYPKIKGDQALYFIFNDNLAVHGSSFTPMGIEVQGMAYAYGCSGVVNGRNELTYTTFYDYKIINRSSINYHDVFVSMWSDVDLGYYGDDYIGSNVADNYGYAYNGTGNDSISPNQGYGHYIPAQAVNILKGPIANAMDGIDNNNNGIIDEIGEDCKLSKFNYFNNSFAGVPINTTDPANGQEFYDVMNGNWRDGTPFTCGGTGYGGTLNTNWVYSGDPNNAGVNTDPNNTCGYWIEGASVPGDRRMILSSGPFTLNAGQMQEVEYAFVTSFDSSSTTNSNLLSVAKLKTDIQKVNTFYNLVNKPNCLQALTAGINEVVEGNDFVLFPNPAKSLITISSNIIGTLKVNYEIVDVLGKVILQNENNSSDKFIININNLNSGIYFLKLQVNNSVAVKKFVKE